MRSEWPFLILAAGCLPPKIRTTTDMDPIVLDVSIRGNGSAFSGTGDYLVESAMVQQDSPRFWRLSPRERATRLNTDELYRDAWRIETWYAHQGFFDARFLGWEVVSVRSREGRTPVVSVIGHVDEGPATMITAVSWVLVDDQGRPLEQSFESVVGGPLARQLRNKAPAQVGDRFILGAHNETKAETELRLEDMSFAYATVYGEVDIHADEQTAELRYLCRPGPPCRFGELTLSGESKVPERLIRDQFDITSGQAYSAKAIASTQRDLFALGTFSVVNVVAELETPEPLPPSEGVVEAPAPPSDVVPVRIELQDSRWRQLRIGGGVAAENGKQQLRTSVDFRHSNLLNRLLNLQIEAQGGYTWLADGVDVLSEDTAAEASSEQLSGGPSVLLGLGLDAPRFLRPGWRLENELSFELGVEESYQFATPAFATALTWSPRRHWTLGLGSSLQYFSYFNTIDSWRALSTSGSDLDTQNPYFLTLLSQSLLYDSRSDPIAPVRGSYVSLTLDEALPPGMFDFMRLEIEGRHYVPVGRLLDALVGWYPRMTLAGKLGGGLIRPYRLFGDGRDSVPFAERLYLGGSNSVRGWQNDHLGPYAWSCADDDTWSFSDGSTQLSDEESECLAEIIPTGGQLSTFGSLELRTYLPGQWEDVGFALFADAGMAWSELAEVRELPPQVSLGAGVRYKTPVGPLRVDFARRLSDPAFFAHEDRFAFYFSLSEAF